MPGAGLRIATKVFADVATAGLARSVDHLQLHVVGQHAAQGVEVTRIEALDIMRQADAFGLYNSGG